MNPRAISRLLLALTLTSHAGATLADRADRDKPINLEADRVDIDDARQISTFTGHVLLTQGTLTIDGDKIIVTQDRSGFRHGTITGRLAHFRQKREGLNEYVDGHGERIEYDTGSEIMNLYQQAHVQRGLDDVRGNHITYNIKTEIFEANGSPEKSSDNGRDSRVHVIIQPRADSASSPPAPSQPESFSIKPDTRLPAPGGEP